MSSAFHSGDDEAVEARFETADEPVPHFIDGAFVEHTDPVRHGPFLSHRSF